MAAIRSFTKQMFQVAAEKKLWMRILGFLEDEPMWLIRSREVTEHTDPKMLIISGFHGEEVAGPWAILKWLKTCDTEVFKKIDLSFIPIINPVGFRKGTRYRVFGERNNQGFCHPEGANACKAGEKRSLEGDIIFDNKDALLQLAKDGYLSLHEDALIREYYVYTFDKRRRGPMARGLLTVLSNHFKKPLDGLTTNGITEENLNEYPGEKGIMVRNGWVNHNKLHDGSFEDFLFHENIPRVAVSETPGMYKLRRRIDAGVDVIGKFIEISDRLRKRAG